MKNIQILQQLKYFLELNLIFKGFGKGIILWSLIFFNFYIDREK